MTAALVIMAALLMVRLWLSAFELTARGAIVVVAGVIVLAVVLTIGASLMFFAMSTRVDAEAEGLQHVMTRRLRDAVGDLPLTVVAHVPRSRRSPVVIEIVGSVPTAEIRDQVLRATRHEASTLGRDIRVADRLEVRSATDRPAA